MLADITEITEIKNKLNEQSNLLKTVINKYPSSIILKDYNGKISVKNNSMEIPISQ